MDNCQLFMVAERRDRIKKNNNKMEKLKYEIELLIPKCKQILTLRDEYKKLEENIKELDNEYLIQKDNKVLFEKSDRIEELYEQLQQKEEQFNFVQSLKESFNPKKRFATIFSSFKKYYKYKKQVAREELDEYISLFEVGYSYYKQYRNLKNISFNTEEEISELFLAVEEDKNSTLFELNQIEEQLSTRRKFLWSYPKKKEQMEIRMAEIKTEISQIHNSEEYKKYSNKVKKYSDLYNENEIYQGQIDNMVEMTKVKPFVKRRKAA